MNTDNTDRKKPVLKAVSAKGKPEDRKSKEEFTAEDAESAKVEIGTSEHRDIR